MMYIIGTRAALAPTTSAPCCHRGDTFSGIPLDFFATSPRYWGMTMFVRTGPTEWSREAMAALLRLGTPGHAYGGITVGGVEIDVPDETDAFEHLGLRRMEPSERSEMLLKRIGR